MKTSGIRALLFVVAIGVAPLACGDVDDDADAHNGQAADSIAADGSLPADSAAAADAAAADSVFAGAPVDSADAVAADADPFAGFQLDAAPGATGEVQTIALLLRNDADHLSLVYADGGAGEVFLDSVPPGADTRVDVQTRATAVTLRSEGPAGEPLRTTEVTAGPEDTVLEVFVARADTSR